MGSMAAFGDADGAAEGEHTARLTANSPEAKEHRATCVRRNKARRSLERLFSLGQMMQR